MVNEILARLEKLDARIKIQKAQVNKKEITFVGSTLNKNR